VLDIITWSSENNSIHNCWEKCHHKHAWPKAKVSCPTIGPTLFCRNPFRGKL